MRWTWPSLRWMKPAILAADLVAFYLPMHTATRLAIPVIERVKQLNPRARLACYGLYAPLNRELLRGLGVEAAIGAEFEPALVQLANGDSLSEENGAGSMPRLTFLTPDRSGLPDLSAYSHLRRTAPK